MTLYALLNALGIEDLTSSEIGGWPSYASSLFIELLLRQSDRTPYFRVSLDIF